MNINRHLSRFDMLDKNQPRCRTNTIVKMCSVLCKSWNASWSRQQSTKTKCQKCSLSSFKTISTTHLAQGPLKTHNIQHILYIHKKNSRKKGNTDHCCAVCCAITFSTCSSYIVFCHLLSVCNRKMFNLHDIGIYILGLLDQYNELVMYSNTWCHIVPLAV